MFMAVGTFTDCFMGGAPAEGIYVFAVDPAAGTAEPVQVVSGLFSPSFLCRHPSRPLLYSAERQWSAEDKTTGAVATWRIDPASGRLEQAGRCRSGGAFTAHISISPDGRIVTTANPLGPTVASFLLDYDGTARRPAFVATHYGSGARERQAAPWPHSTFTTRDGKRLLACDLALDRVMIYDIDENDGRLTPARQPFAQVGSGAGSRHLAISANGRFVYVVNELDCTLSVFAWDAESGRMTTVQTVPTVAWALVDSCQPAEIVIAPDGATLYVTNRGSETVGIFAVDAATGRVAPAGQVPTLGKVPRHITLSPDGAYAFVCNQLSGEVVVFAVDRASGGLEPTGQVIPVPSASCAVVW